jgi:hypothetical protein
MGDGDDSRARESVGALIGAVLWVNELDGTGQSNNSGRNRDDGLKMMMD